MGWFGVSQTQNRNVNLLSMQKDADDMRDLKVKTEILGSALETQLNRAGELTNITASQPVTTLYRGQGLVATAGQLAVELNAVLRDGEAFRHALGNLVKDVDEAIEIQTQLGNQYQVPRGQRGVRLTEQNVPPSGMDMAVFSRALTKECKAQASKLESDFRVRATRCSNTVDKADHVIFDWPYSSSRTDTVLRELKGLK